MTNQLESPPAPAGLYERLLFSEQQVDQRIREMAAEIVERYRGVRPLFISLLNGAAPFTAKLMTAIQHTDPTFHPNVQSMIVSRYGTSRHGGEPRVVTDLPPQYRDLSGRHVIILDDLIDAGGTICFTERHLLDYGAAGVDRIVLVKRRKDPPVGVELALFGFEAPDVWLTGMGMDDERLATEGNRWAGWIAVARPA